MGDLKATTVGIGPEVKVELSLQDKFENALKVWKNNGFDDPEDQFDKSKADKKISYLDMVDALSTPDASVLIPKVIARVVKEAIEPLLVGEQLLQKVRFSAGQQITFPAAGAFVAADIAEGQEYPQRKLGVGGSVTAFIGKSGLAVAITEEMLRYSQYIRAAYASNGVRKNGAQSGKPKPVFW